MYVPAFGSPSSSSSIVRFAPKTFVYARSTTFSRMKTRDPSPYWPVDCAATSFAPLTEARGQKPTDRTAPETVRTRARMARRSMSSAGLSHGDREVGEDILRFESAHDPPEQRRRAQGRQEGHDDEGGVQVRIDDPRR